MSLMYFKLDLFRRHMKKWGYVAKNGFKWLFFCMGKTHKYIVNHVRTITPKLYGIYPPIRRIAEGH